MKPRPLVALLGTTAPLAYASAPPGQLVGVRTGDPAKAAAVAAQVGTQGIAPMSDADITKRSPDSAAMVEYWDLTDALIAGAAAVRAGGEKWFPKFADEPNERYNMRLRFTKYTNVYGDIIENLASKPFEKEVSLVGDAIPETFTKFIENVDGAGNNLTVFASNVFYNGINSAVDWIFIDAPAPDPTVRTRGDAIARNIRPYWSRVLGRNILDAKSEVVGADEKLSYIKILEPGSPDRIREFFRDGETVTWRLWEKKPDTFWNVIDDGSLSIDSIPLVPFATGRREGRAFRWHPPMRSAADLQIELFLEESGLKFVKQLSNYPILTGNGVKPERDEQGNVKPIATGPGSALYAPPDSSGTAGSWTYIQPDAANMKFSADDAKETISQLRELGRMPLTAQSGNLTVITAAAAAGKARSAVGAWAYALKDALENAFVLTGKFMRETFEPEVAVYTEFDAFTDDTENDILSADRDRGDISRRTLWAERKRRGVYSSEFNADDEEKALLDETPGDGEDTDPDATT